MWVECHPRGRESERAHPFKVDMRLTPKTRETYVKLLVKYFPPVPIEFIESSSGYDDLQSGIKYFTGKTWVQAMADQSLFHYHDDTLTLLEHPVDKVKILPAYLYMMFTDDYDMEPYALCSFLINQKNLQVLTAEQARLVLSCASLFAGDETIGLDHEFLPAVKKMIEGK